MRLLQELHGRNIYFLHYLRTWFAQEFVQLRVVLDIVMSLYHKHINTYKAHTGFLCLHLTLAWLTETLQLSPVYAIRGVIRPACIVPLCHCLYSPSVVEVVKEYKWIAWLCEIFECLPDSVDHGWVAKWSGQKSLVHSAAVPIMSGWVHECFLD